MELAKNCTDEILQRPARLPVDLTALLPAVEAIAREAGRVILEVYGAEFEVRSKADRSPVTEADERAEAVIVPALRTLAPAWPVVAEEAAARGEAPDPAALAGATFWLVDPLDGTREFVARNGEFTVNIALVCGGEPVLGVVYLPVPDHLFAGVVGQGAWREAGGQREPVAARHAPAAGPVVACSRAHGDPGQLRAWLDAHPGATLREAGSSLKFGLLAEGGADAYPRFGRTMEWDTAAGDAVLRAAGGRVCDLAGNPLRYGKPGFENPFFVARGLLPGEHG